MADEDKESKTENPTEKRLNDAREEGDVPVSKEVSGAAAILAFSVYLTVHGRSSIAEQIEILRSIPDIYSVSEEISAATLVSVFQEVTFETAYTWVPLFFWVMAASLAGSAFQGKLRIVGKRIAADYSRISPASGWKRLTSFQSVAEFFKALLKLSIPTYIIYISKESHIDNISSIAFMGYEYAINLIFNTFRTIALSASLIYCLVAVLDFLWQRYSWVNKLKMSRQQIKEEVKQSEGDPAVKGRLFSLRRERARRRMMQSVPASTLVIANPTHFAIALRYDRDKDPAPVVVATGTNLVALKIREIAEENQVPVFERVELARALYKAVKIDQMIPPQFYKAIAEIIRIISEGKKYGYVKSVQEEKYK